MHIARLSPESYSQCKVARMLCVSQQCISIISRPDRDTGRPHQWRRGGRRNLTTARKVRQLIWMVRDNRWEGIQKIWSQALEALCLWWWVSLHAVSQWWLCSYIHVSQARAEIDRCAHPTHRQQPWPLSHGMGCHSQWWVKWTGGTGCNPQPPILHQASLR